MVSQTDSPTLEALRNWHPRMIANGVDYNDAEETLKRVESWEDWCREWCDTAAVPGDWPVAVVPQAVLSDIGGRSRTLRLGSDSLAGQPDYERFEIENWLRVQRIVDEGGVLEEDGAVWRTAIAAAVTEDGRRETRLERLERG